MPSTVKYAISYPAGTTAPNVPVVMQTQAESVEAALTGITKTRHAEYTSALVALTAGTSRDVGAFTPDAAVTFNNTFVQPDVAGKVKFLEAGVYSLDFIALPPSTPGTLNIQIMGVTQNRIAQATGGNYGAWEVSASASNIYLAANEIVTFNVVCNNSINIGARVRITKIQG
jgi:hypothetical protein